MQEQHIPLIMEIIGNIVLPDDRKRKYTDRQILKIPVLLQVFRVSYRLAVPKEIPSFQTLSRRARLLDLHAMNREITFLHSMEEIAAVDSFMIHTCKYSTAARRKVWGYYRDPESGWSKTTKGWSYGRKCHMTLDADSLLIMDWLITKGVLFISLLDRSRKEL